MKKTYCQTTKLFRAKRKIDDTEKQVQNLASVLQQITNEKLMSTESMMNFKGRFSDTQIKVVQGLLGEKPKVGEAYTAELKDFAVTLYYYSPKAYRFASKLLTLPSPRTIRSYVGSIDCYPGFQVPAFDELSRHMDDPNYKEASLIVDGMSLKELIQFDPKLGKCFGYVDLGGSNSGGEDVQANESLVAMVVGLKGYWKLPVAYFLIRGMQSDIFWKPFQTCLTRKAGVGSRQNKQGRKSRTIL